MRALLFFLCWTLVAAPCALAGNSGEDGSGGLRILTESGSSVTRVVVRALASHMKIHDYQVTSLPWARAYRMALSEPDIMLFPMARTPEREDLFQWVGPIMTVEWAFYALKGSNVNPANLEQAKKVRRIGTYKDDAREVFLKNAGFTNLDSSYNQRTNFGKLEKGRVDLVAGSTASFSGLDHDFHDKFECVLVFKKAQLYMAFSRKTGKDTVQAWENGLMSFIRSGEMARHCCPVGACPERVSANCPGF